MDLSKSCGIACFIMIIMFCSSTASLVDLQTDNIFNVSAYGAISSSAKSPDSKKFFLAAWKKACATRNGVFLIPAGTYYLSKALFEGPCIGQTTVKLNGLVSAFLRASGSDEFWIKFSGVTGLTIDGPGTLDGNGAASWPRTCKSCTYPTTLSLYRVQNAKVSNIKLVNSKMFHMIIYGSERVTVNRLTVTAPGDSPNTDGIKIGRSSFVQVLNTAIGTGDDCIAILDGSNNVKIDRVSCGPGHGFSIGSLGKYAGEKDVSAISITNCHLSNTTNGVRIKTLGNSRSSTTVNRVTFQHITMTNVDNPIIVDQHYCPSRNCPTVASSVQLKGLKFIDVRGSSTTKIAVKLDCSASKPCEDVILAGINIKYRNQPTKAICSDAYTKFIGLTQMPPKCNS